MNLCKSVLTLASVAILATAPPDLSAAPSYTFTALLPVQACTSADLSPDGSKVYVRHNFAPNDDGYRVFDAQSLALLDEFHVADTPWTGRVSVDGKFLWTSRYYGGLLSKIDLQTWQIVETLGLGSFTVDTLFDGDKHYLYVGENHPGTGAIGSVKVVDTWVSPAQLVATVPLNGEPAILAKGPFQNEQPGVVMCR